MVNFRALPRLLLAVVCLSVTQPASAVPVDPLTSAASTAMSTRFERTVAALQLQPADSRALFAQSALYELSLAYQEEASLARLEADHGGGDASLMAWSRAVERYAAVIDMLLADIEDGFPVELRMDTGAGASVAVEQRVTMLNHPRLGEQARFEQQVLEHFCAQINCAELTGSSRLAQPVRMSTESVRPLWSFTADGPVCSYRGLTFEFATDVNITRARELCVQVMNEAVLLADQIAWQRQHGVTVEWDVLTIHATAGRPQHRLQLNLAGDSIVAVIPLIYSSKGLLERLIPWVRPAAESGTPSTVRVLARDIGWLQLQ